MPQSATLERIDEKPVTLEALFREAERLEVTPGWIKRENPIFWSEPRSAFVPMRWRYAPIKKALEAANDLIDVALAERRTLVMRNPHPSNNFATSRTTVCAYQSILPGETAPSHRHASHALRVLLDAKGTYSIVNGERLPMESGDIVLTPGGSWHGHGHDGDEPACWLDALDVPMTHLLEPMYYEENPNRYEQVTSVVTDSPFRFSRESIARRLDSASAHPDGLHGPRIELDASEMPSMGLSVQRLPSGMITRLQRSTANRIFVVMEGSGETDVSGRTFPWTRGDTIVVPTWNKFSHRAESDAVLFETSDEPVMRFLKYFWSELD